MKRNSSCKSSWQSLRSPGALKIPVLLVLLLGFTMLSTRMFAQSTAQISGAVHDQTNGLIPGAQVTVTNTDTGTVQTATANGEGLYAFPALHVGHYRLEAKAPGFKKYVQAGLVLTVSQELKLDIQLVLGVAEQVIEVTADAAQVDATSPTEQSTVEESMVQGLPLNGRNPASLVKSVAGVTDTTLNVSETDTNSNIKPADAVNPLEFAPAIHGARAGGVYFSLDGANNTDPYTIIGGPFPHPDATGEFSVVTGTYGARYESAPGGAINVVTRSGTNRLHGSVFEFLRNGYFNARTPLDPNPDVLKRNQFGFALGGPILQNKLFFFGSYQATPTHDNQTSTGYFPTAANREGTFYNASTGKTFTMPNSINLAAYGLGTGTYSPMQSATSGAMKHLLAIVPTATAENGAMAFDSPQNSNDQQGLLKLEYNRGSHQIFARYMYDRYTLAPQGMTSQAMLAAIHQGYVMPFTNLAAGDTHTRGNLIFETRAAYILAQVKQPMAPEVMSYSALGITNLSGYGADPGLTNMQGNGEFLFNEGAPMYIPRKGLEFSENVFWTKGKNQISFGGSYRRISINETGYAFRGPLAMYYGVSIATLGGYGAIPGASGDVDPVADFVMGAPFVFVQSDGFFTNVSGNLWGIYGEDNYRVNDKLTVTAGLRWDPYLAYKSKNNRGINCFDTSLSTSAVYPNAPAGMLFAGDKGCSASGMTSSLLQLQPRLGLAYQFGGKHKTALRLGYGLYDMQFPLKTYVGVAYSSPWVRMVEKIGALQSLDNIYGGNNPFAAGFNGPSYVPSKDVTFASGMNVSTFSQNFKQGYMQQWSFSAQHELSAKDSIDIAYIGTTGTHLTIGDDINAPVYGLGATTSNESARRPYQGYQTIAVEESNGTSAYQGVDVTLRHRSHNFQLTPAFTWSKSIDDLSEPPQAGTVNNPTTNHHFRRGLSTFDQKYDFRVTGSWSSPELKQKSRAVREVAGAWTVSGLITLDSGQPFSVTASADNSMSGESLDLADRVPGKPVWVNGVLNPAAFTVNAVGTFGDSGRNAFRSPSNDDVDAALAKDFQIIGRLNTTFRAETFNLFNHANFLPPNSAYGSTGFGEHTTARSGRIMQFSLKISSKS